MREIKFRAWDKQYNNMNYKILIGNVHDTDERYTAHCMWIKPENVDYKCEPHWCHFDEWSNIEIMQYTGLKDKNGKEIYEGDICKVINYASDYLKIQGKMYCVISWSNTTGFYGKGFGVPTTFSMGEEFEVIGNIYENHELLEQK